MAIVYVMWVGVNISLLCRLPETFFDAGLLWNPGGDLKDVHQSRLESATNLSTTFCRLGHG